MLVQLRTNDCSYILSTLLHILLIFIIICYLHYINYQLYTLNVPDETVHESFGVVSVPEVFDFQANKSQAVLLIILGL